MCPVLHKLSNNFIIFPPQCPCNAGRVAEQIAHFTSICIIQRLIPFLGIPTEAEFLPNNMTSAAKRKRVYYKVSCCICQNLTLLEEALVAEVQMSGNGM